MSSYYYPVMIDSMICSRLPRPCEASAPGRVNVYEGGLSGRKVPLRFFRSRATGWMLDCCYRLMYGLGQCEGGKQGS